MQRPWPAHLMRAVVVLVLAVAAVVSFGPAGEASAHPLGNFTINRYARIELYRGEAVVHYVIDFAEIPTFQLKQSIDVDGNGTVEQPELDSFLAGLAAAIASELELTAGGEIVDLRTAEYSGDLSGGEGSLETLRVALVLRGPVDQAGSLDVQFVDENYAGRAGWREIVVWPSPGTAFDGDPALLVDRSGGLRSYPEDATAATMDRVSFRWNPATGAHAPIRIVPETGEAEVSDVPLAGLLRPNRSLGVILFSLVAAMGFGALHALGPGHGKTVVAAYLVGSKGTAWHALILGLAVTATHTAAVYALGLVTLVGSDLVAPDRLLLWLGVLSGAMIAVLGGSLLLTRAKTFRRHSAHEGNGAHRHGLFGREHSHAPQAHKHGIAQGAHPTSSGWYRRPERWANAGPHSHSSVLAVPAVEEPAAPAGRSLRGLLTLGVAGGLIPCPSALVVMLAAISLGQALFGMLLIVAFSVGLSAVLVAIGLALVFGRRLTAGRTESLVRRPALARMAAMAPVVSAAAVTLAGIAITYQALNQPGL